MTSNHSNRIRRSILTLGGCILLLFAVPTRAQRFSEWSAPENLGPPINTSAFEGAPFISKDGLDLLFASNRATGSPSGVDIYVSHRETTGSPWGDPVSLGPTINMPGFDDSFPFLTISGRHLFFVSTRPGGCGNFDIYVARRLDKKRFDKWSEPENLGCQVNSAGPEFSPSIFEDEDGMVYLYFSSGLRPGGMGFGDIYFTTLQPDGSWGPVSPVSEFNTPFNEIRPDIRRRDGLEIFFDSLRPGSMMADIYTSQRACTLCPWEDPVNLAVLNSGAIDGGARLSFDGTELYFMSNRPGTFGLQDIWVSRRTRLTGEPEIEPR
ncbi:MAG: hypothetical protein LC795_14780 [Acidobacteria bacterium]|nr:hypothetical protein [Acidobacteriota bacterium]